MDDININVPKSQTRRVLTCELVNIMTGEVHKFGKVKHADDFLGKARGYTSKHMREDCIAIDSKGIVFKIIPGGVHLIETAIESRPVQLCWTCQNAVGGCSWSNGSFTPIKGWTAEPTSYHYSKCNCEQGYAISACPEYIHD